MRFYLIFAVFFILHTCFAYSQCNCPGTAPIIITSPLGGTNDQGLINPNQLRISTVYKYIYGDSYKHGDSKGPDGLVKSFNTNYAAILFSYGLSSKFAIEAETGYYLNKTQDFRFYVLSGNGFSHFALYGKYNLFYSYEDQMDWTIIGGVKTPMPQSAANNELPKYIQPSNIGVGPIFESILHKRFDGGYHSFLVNRFDLNTNGAQNFRYGNTLINSLFVSRMLLENFVAIGELRNEIRWKDRLDGAISDSSGGVQLIFSPQINLYFDNWNFSLIADIPLYSYYNGYQLKNNFGISLNANWFVNFVKKEEL